MTGVFLTCMCGLMLQITETRFLSIVAYYYLAFFAIGLAMLGMTAGALIVFYRFSDQYEPTQLASIISRVMALFAWATLFSLIVLTSLAFDPKYVPTLRFYVVWMMTIFVLLPPYVLLGVAISLALTRSQYRISYVYATDLIGAAVGCLATLLLLTVTDVYTAIILIGAVGALASVAFCSVSIPRQRSTGTYYRRSSDYLLSKPSIALGVLILLAAANHVLGFYGLRPVVLKNLSEIDSPPIIERWNSFSRVSVQDFPAANVFLSGPSPLAPNVSIDERYVAIDAGASTLMYRYTGDPAQVDFLRYDLTALGYYIRHDGRAAIIGVGGGRDILTASIFGFTDITGIEYNPIISSLFWKEQRDFDGVDRIHGLSIFTDEARSWLARHQDRFDLIQMSLIDTWAATGAGAFTLSENGLYTVNGWKRIISRLTPKGVFVVSRWYSPNHMDETARLVSLAMATLIELGEERASAHIYLASSGNLSTLLVGRNPLSEEDVRVLDATVDRLQFNTVVAPTRNRGGLIFKEILNAKTTGELMTIGLSWPLNLTPTWDSSPFFFNQLRLSHFSSVQRAMDSGSGGVAAGNLTASLTLLTLVLLSAMVVAAVIIAPAVSLVRSLPVRTTIWSSAYFLCIGIAFMFVEISLVQRMSVFLGHPIYGLAIVLLGIILATGIGSALSEKAVPLTPPALVGWPIVLATYLASLPFWLGGVVDAAEGGSLLHRSAICLLIMIPAGVLMGLLFPTGMRLATRINSHVTPWLWAINGASGVLASGATVLLGIEFSLNLPLWLGAGVYALVSIIGLQLLRLTRRTTEENVSAPQTSNYPQILTPNE